MTKPIALQLYTVRDLVAADYLGTLRAVAEMGYGAVEMTTLGNFSAQDLRTELDALGLHIAGMHVPLDRLERDLSTVLADLQTLGARYVICPWIAVERRGSVENYRQVAQTLNRIGEQCHAQGLQLCYHNHEFEFEPIDGTTGLDILMDETDPQFLQAELDVYWAAYAHLDPVPLIHSLAGRLPLVHLKDMSPEESRTYAELGHGTLDFPAILAACDEANVEWQIVEQDRCARPPLESVRMSIDYLRSLGRV